MFQDILNVPFVVHDDTGDAWAVSLLGREEEDGDWTGWLAYVSSVEGPARLDGPVARMPSMEDLFSWGRELTREEVEESFKVSQPVDMDVVAPRPPDWGTYVPHAPGPPYQA
ncbi:MAG: hypothetical protein L0Y66_13095 [Myxococcaceae bacterium]|nr:hypothetical protein [Myxococcaceae bacterium]MCI0671818.1 hypothetical protein [Myxococcaceae bacterium]